jgi:hypothetical protein
MSSSLVWAAEISGLQTVAAMPAMNPSFLTSLGMPYCGSSSTSPYTGSGMISKAMISA